jgi:hypothetical protein
MSSAVRRIGAALPDAEMQVYDHKLRQLVSVDWTKVDKPFEQIRPAMLSLPTATLSGDYLMPEFTPISDQGHAGSCVANGCSDAFEILQGIDYGPDKVQQLSRRWLYYISRQYHGATKVDNGTFIRAALHQEQTIGTFEERFFPYYDDPQHITGDLSMPELDCYTMASNNRISGFYQLTPGSDSFLDDVELAVRANHPVIYATKIGKEFESYAGGGAILQPTASSLGGHCNIITGVRHIGGQRVFWTRNSWTAAWGDNGHALVSEDFMKGATDAWVATTTLKLIR